MEKLRYCCARKRCNRLLIISVLSLMSQLVLAQDFERFNFFREEELLFEQNGENFTESDIDFVIYIQDENPSDIVIGEIDLPPNVIFISASKKASFVKNENGEAQKATTLIYTVRFLKDGPFSLNALPIKIGLRKKQVNFPMVSILPNPKTFLPEVFFESSNSLYHLQKGELVLSARYFKHLVDFEVEVSEKALIEKHYTIQDYSRDDETFSDEKIVIARFSCIPFSGGLLELPFVKISFIGYDDKKHIIELKDQTLPVLESQNLEESKYGKERLQEDDVFFSCLSNSLDDIEKKEDVVVRLAQLRGKEKYAFLPFGFQKERKHLELKENIRGDDEVSFTWTIIIFSFSIIICLLAIILMRLKSEKNSSSLLLVLFLGILLLVASLFYGYDLKNQYVLTFGTHLYTIPEYGSTYTVIEAGTKVKLLKLVGDWYLIEKKDGRIGWVLDADCVFIKSQRNE